MKYFKILITTCLAIILLGCVSIGSTQFAISQSVFTNNYLRIKGIVVEEAANNGFGSLTSEIKPSEFNGFKGKLFFQLVTANGTDQLFVEFEKAQENVSIYIHGAGTRSNPDSASKAIRARVEQAFSSVPSQIKPSGNISNVQSSPTNSVSVPASNQKSIEPVASARETTVMSTVDAQVRLISLGYLNGKADGIFGKSSTSALLKFQQDQRISVTGKLDTQTVDRLRSAAKK